jgi:hypothetical protein
MPPTGGPEGTLAGVARRLGETETSFRESVRRREVMPVAHHPGASACSMKFSRAYSHRTIVGGIGHNRPQEAPEASTEAVLLGGGRGT